MIRSPIERARVFVVDDHEANVRLLERLLARAGFDNLRSFGDGAAMLHAFDEDEPDIVLLDLHMPGLDGFAVLEALRARAAGDGYLPVLVLTGDGERSARSRALTSGANDFLIKPFDAEEVVLRVRNLLETRLLHRALRARNTELVSEVAARMSDLERSEADWSALAASLGGLSALATPEATAEAICASLASLPDLEFISIMSFAPGDVVIPLAGRPAIAAKGAAGAPLPDAWSRLIRDRAAAGTWLGPWSMFSDDARLEGPFPASVTAAALVPLRTNSGTIGVLAAGATGCDGLSRVSGRVPALEAYAALAAALLAPGVSDRQLRDEIRRRVGGIISTAAFNPVFQPIVHLESGRVVGYEALTRFADGTPPDRMFAGATTAGVGLDLEVACLSAAIAAARDLPTDCWLSLNVSPALILEGARLEVLLRIASTPIVLEITEHAPIADYSAFRSAIASLRGTVRLAIDDAGAGFSSFRHILELAPNFVKLDLGLVRSIDRDRARQALVAGMVYFARRTACDLIGEGIETPTERETLRSLGVQLGQGYVLGRPEPLPAVVMPEASQTARRSPAPSPRRARSGDDVSTSSARATVGRSKASSTPWPAPH